MFVISSWDEHAEITYIPPERVIDDGDEDRYFALRPRTPARPDEFIVFEAAKLELIAHLEERKKLFEQRIEAIRNTDEASTRARTEHANFVRANPHRIIERSKMPAGMDFDDREPESVDGPGWMDPNDHAAAFERDLGPQGETL